MEEDPGRAKSLARKNYRALRFTYREQGGGLWFDDLQRNLDDIIDLFVVVGNDLVNDPFDQPRIDEQIERARKRVRQETRVVRLHYNPVLEISIAAGIAAATAIIALWKRYSEGRVEASRADIAESEADVAIEKAKTVIGREKLEQDLIARLRYDLEMRRLRQLESRPDAFPDPALDEVLHNATEAVILPKQIDGVDENNDALEI